ncbi:MAG TPA: hypothetical protein VK888_11170 [Anaerolineales bacterium]|nr:hypothetical protein [Anaerolineales bacterium]
MNIPSEILERWQQHSSAPVPKGYGSKNINGIDLPFLEAEMGGSIRMYISSGGQLDSRRIRSLQEHLIELNTIILLMEREELAYFDRLRRLATLVLQEVKK